MLRRKKKKPDVLKDNMFRGVADTLAEMELYDKLNEEFEKIEEKYRYIPEDVQQCTCLLREVAELCDCYDQSGIETPALYHRIQRFLSAAARKILLSPKACVEGEHSLDEALKVIADLMKSKNGWINNECQKLYKSHEKPEKGLMGTIARTDRVAERYCDSLMTEIFIHLDSEDEADHLCAAELLLKFLHTYSEDHDELGTRDSLMVRTKAAKKKLNYRLFTVIINEYNNHRKLKTENQHGKISSAMSHHKSRFIRLIPHMYLLKNDNTKMLWKHIACWCVVS